MPTADTDTDLPVPVDSARTYVDVVPADDALDPATVETHLRRLHRLGSDESTGILSRLRGVPSLPTIEYLLVSEGGNDPQIRQSFGVDDDHVQVLERTLRGLYPTSYELERSTGTAAALTGGFETDDVAAVEFHGIAERPTDWQTRLTPFHDFCERNGPLPLSAIVEAMADTTCAVVYQVLLQPMADWTGRADERRHALETHRDTLGGKLAHSLYGPPDEEVRPRPATRRASTNSASATPVDRSSATPG